MDDNNGNLESIQPEEVSPEVVTPEQAGSAPPPEIPPEEMAPVYEENKSKYLIIGGMVIFFLLIFFFIFKFIFGRANTTSSKQIKLVYWGLWEDKEIIQPLIQEYQAQHKNITIEYQKMTPQEYRQKLIARSKNGQGPDIFRYHNTWLSEIKDVAAPMPASVMSNIDFEKTFYPIQQKDLKIGDSYFGLPLEIDGLVLICNDNILKSNGIVLAPTKWEDLMIVVRKISEAKDTTGRPLTAGIAMGTANNIEHFSDIFGLILMQNGGDLTNIDNEAGTGALESYREFAEDPNKRVWDENMPNSINAFIQEKVAMIFAPSWWIVNIKSANPDIKIKVMPAPTFSGGKPLSIANYWVEGVSRYSNNQLEAWKFLRFLTEKESLTKLYENASKIKLFGEPYSRVDMGSLLAQHEYLGPVIQQASYYVSIPLISRTYDAGLNDEINKYLENAINATIQGASYQEALTTAKQGITQVMKKYNLLQ